MCSGALATKHPMQLKVLIETIVSAHDVDEREEEDAQVEVALLGAVRVQRRAEEQRGDHQRVEQHLERQDRAVFIPASLVVTLWYLAISSRSSMTRSLQHMHLATWYPCFPPTTYGDICDNPPSLHKTFSSKRSTAWRGPRLACAEDVQEPLAAQEDQLAAEARPQQVDALVAVLLPRLQAAQASEYMQTRWTSASPA